MSLIIEVIGTNGANVPTPRTFSAKGDRPARTVYEQKVYAHLGGAFPVEMKLSFDDHKDAYPIGKYELSKSSFKVGQYGDLQIDRYNTVLTPLADFADKKAS